MKQDSSGVRITVAPLPPARASCPPTKKRPSARPVTTRKVRIALSPWVTRRPDPGGQLSTTDGEDAGVAAGRGGGGRGPAGRRRLGGSAWSGSVPATVRRSRRGHE